MATYWSVSVKVDHVTMGTTDENKFRSTYHTKLHSNNYHWARTFALLPHIFLTASMQVTMFTQTILSYLLAIEGILSTDPSKTFDSLLSPLMLRCPQTRKQCCGNIVAVAKMFLNLFRDILLPQQMFVACAPRKHFGKQCFRKNVSSFAGAFK